MNDKFLGKNIRVREGARNLPGLKQTIDQSTTKILRLEETLSRLEPLLRIDPSTELLNKTGMWYEIWRNCGEIGRESEKGRSKDGLGFVFYDFVNFHTVNDEIGQENGDIVLREGASVIKNTHRNTDHIARYGGDEDLAIMRVNNEEELSNILNVRHDREGQESVSILDLINRKMKLFMKKYFPDFVRDNGEITGTLKSGFSFVTNDEIVNNGQENLEEIIRSRLNELSMRVKGK